jgi:hypothetical protein
MAGMSVNGAGASTAYEDEWAAMGESAHEEEFGGSGSLLEDEWEATGEDESAYEEEFGGSGSLFEDEWEAAGESVYEDELRSDGFGMESVFEAPWGAGEASGAGYESSAEGPDPFLPLLAAPLAAAAVAGVGVHADGPALRRHGPAGRPRGARG